jgi:hypothetical protein
MTKNGSAKWYEEKCEDSRIHHESHYTDGYHQGEEFCTDTDSTAPGDWFSWLLYYSDQINDSSNWRAFGLLSICRDTFMTDSKQTQKFLIM